MTEIWTQAALWLGLALLAGDASWIKFLVGAGPFLGCTAIAVLPAPTFL